MKKEEKIDDLTIVVMIIAEELYRNKIIKEDEIAEVMQQAYADILGHGINTK